MQQLKVVLAADCTGLQATQIGFAAGLRGVDARAQAQNQAHSNRETPMTVPHARSAQRALVDSSLALLAACLAIAMFLPPLAAATAASPWREAVAIGVVVLALPLHWLGLVAAARRLGVPPAGWLGLAVVLCPVGGAAALILLAGLLHPSQAQASAVR